MDSTPDPNILKLSDFPSGLYLLEHLIDAVGNQITHLVPVSHMTGKIEVDEDRQYLIDELCRLDREE